MGAGEYAGQYANLRALVYVIGPTLFTRVYATLAGYNLNTGLTFGVMAFLGFILPGLMHASWKTKDMYTPGCGFKDGKVYLYMKGACAGCPSSTATLKHGIQNLLRHFVPEVREVEAV